MTRIRARKRLRIRLIELNIDLFLAVLKEYDYRRERNLRRDGLSGKEILIASKAREHIGYSCKTNDIDIVFGLVKIAQYELKIQNKQICLIR